MKRLNSLIKTIFGLAAAATVMLTAGHASAQTILAKWTFETLTVASGSSLTNFGTGREITNIVAEAGSGIASGVHSGFGSSTWGTVAGNGSTKAWTGNGWTNTPGDYFQFATSTVGYQNIAVSFDQISSATGPGQFYIAYSTDGVNFTQFGGIYLVTNAPAWSSGSGTVLTSYSFDFSSIGVLTNQTVVYFRLVDAAKTNSATTALVGTAGTCRVDNFMISGINPGVPSIVTPPQSATVFYGDSISFSVIANGSAPLSYQWYYPNLSTPLSDGSSGFGAGTISGATNSILTLTFVSTNQSGNYRVVVTNASGSVTSSIAVLVVQTRNPIFTNIAYLHTLHDANFVLTDHTNLYQVEGIVTTSGNLVSPDPASSFFVQDGTGGMDVFFRGGFGFPAQGDHVRIVGPLLQFNGLLEMNPTNANPTHQIVILDSGNPLPAPQYFDYSTTPTPTAMEETYEGKYLVVSNVFFGLTNADPHLNAGQSISMTNTTGQVFKLTVPNNGALPAPGNQLPGSFATSVTGVMSQSQTSGAALTNGYSMLLVDFTQVTTGSPPPPAMSIHNSGTNVMVSWNDIFFTLQSSTNVAGPYTPVSGAATPFTLPASNSSTFFRVSYP